MPKKKCCLYGKALFLLFWVLVCGSQMDHLAHGVAKRRLIRAALKMRMTKTLRPRVAATATLFFDFLRTGGPLTRGDVVCNSHRTHLSKYALLALVCCMFALLDFLFWCLARPKITM